ncbi:MAG: hypothetical protein BJBARM5_0789 [Candidatus Parvarchaeum acidophilus ARMAN-5]|uniref:Type I restriction modification DNA specificity domain-containing protein n=1 Tax=Candidatus Parvarchaeum acidophilus ARMAN-5 TaxID=662762 RepID=D6GWA7_PARA5|nr:MAG: hypothetical protein BJBARM5_0789 [Candidatus Parvarchaeum acidophilus ARMAN-5]
MSTELTKIFDIKYGQKSCHNKSLLDAGKTLVISSKGTDNGTYGFFDLEPKYTSPIVTVPSSGTIGEAFVQDIKCSIGDDCLVLNPKHKMDIDYLYYIAASIRTQKWRYNFGRKITPKRLGTFKVTTPEEFKSQIQYNKLYKKLYPLKNNINNSNKKGNFKWINITTVFNLERGQFHALDRLDKGSYPTISRTGEDNGLIGFYDKPDGAKIYPELTLTISTVSGDAFLQITPFIATDNVVMCIPKKRYKVTTLIYIQSAINKIKWRYSYGRQCYKKALQKTIVYLPLIDKEELDEEYMESVVENTPHWDAFKDEIKSEL